MARRRRRIPRWLWVLLIPAIAVVAAASVTGVFGLFGKGEGDGPRLTTTNSRSSIAVAGAQTGNNTVVDQSVVMPQTLSVGQNTAPIYAPQTVNNYYGVVSNSVNSVTREAFEALENRLSVASDRIELTTGEIKLLAQALRDLDQRTSDIEKLPDGRTKFGSIVTGRPKVVLEAWESGHRYFTNGQFTLALDQAAVGIKAFESTSVDGASMQSGEIPPAGKAALYSLAADSAQRLGSNELANDFAEKAVGADASAGAKILLATTRANLGLEQARKGEPASALGFFTSALDTYREGKDSEGFRSGEELSEENLLRLYVSTVSTAHELGSNDVALKYSAMAAKENSTNIVFQILYASGLSKVGRRDEAAGVINTAFGSDSNSAPAMRLKEIMSLGR